METDGGFIHTHSAFSVKIDDSKFESSTANNGGALYLDLGNEATVDINNSTFKNLKVSYDSSIINSNGAAIFIEALKGSSTINMGTLTFSDITGYG